MKFCVVAKATFRNKLVRLEHNSFEPKRNVVVSGGGGGGGGGGGVQACTECVAYGGNCITGFDRQDNGLICFQFVFDE